MSYNSQKSGFTLVELMMFFLFVTLILAASTPMITKKFKEVPKKVPHGLFMCYYNEAGRLTQAYYNANKEVLVDDKITSCKFNPPKKASLFKIELYGGGAGGYTYHDVSESTEAEIVSYTMAGGIAASDMDKVGKEPTPGELQYMFGGQKVVLCKDTGRGGHGGDIEFTFFPPEDTDCTKDLSGCQENEKNEDGTENLESCASISKRIDLARAARVALNYFHNYTLVSVHDSILNEICNEQQLDGWDGINRASYGTVYGGRGGANQKLKYEYLINFNGIDLSGVPTHLKNLVTKYYITGSATSPGGGGFKAGGSPTAGADGEDIDMKNQDAVLGTTYAADGKDAKKYAAIKLWDHGYVTNSTVATGGTGAELDIDGSDGLITRTPGTDGAPAAGLSCSGSCSGADIGSSCSPIEPLMNITTKLSGRKHVVGNGGGAAPPPTIAVTPSLSNDCVFNLSSGGAAINETSKVTEPTDLQTTLVCNEGTFKVSALGGSNSKTTTPSTWAGFDILKGGYGVLSSSGESGGSSPYSRVRPFTLYQLPKITPGAGGAPSAINDRCAETFGSWDYSMENNSKPAHLSGLIDRNCDLSEEYVDKIPAGSGSPGAIIISW